MPGQDFSEWRKSAMGKAKWAAFMRSGNGKRMAPPKEVADGILSNAGTVRTDLFKQFLMIKGDWANVKFAVKLKKTDTQHATAGTAYLTKQQLFVRYGTFDIVDELIKRKEAAGLWKPCPDLPDIKEARLYLCFNEAVFSRIGTSTKENELQLKIDDVDPDTAQGIASSMMLAPTLNVSIDLSDQPLIVGVSSTAAQQEAKTDKPAKKPRVSKAADKQNNPAKKNDSESAQTPKWHKKVVDAVKQCDAIADAVDKDPQLAGFTQTFVTHRRTLLTIQSELGAVLANSTSLPEEVKAAIGKATSAVASFLIDQIRCNKVMAKPKARAKAKAVAAPTSDVE
jgi:hypothetical protein